MYIHHHFFCITCTFAFDILSTFTDLSKLLNAGLLHGSEYSYHSQLHPTNHVNDLKHLMQP